MNLTQRQLEILVAAADAESFSAAAERLGISQPSLSESIRRIEREIGTQLFSRTTRSLKLTDDGRHAAAIARDIVRDFKAALERLASRGGGRQGRISIAALPSIACAVLPVAIQAFAREHPAIDIALNDVQHDRAIQLVTEGAVDLALTVRPAQSDDFNSRRSRPTWRIWSAAPTIRWPGASRCAGASLADAPSSASPASRRSAG
ncbi:MAG: LysR family transcriptional regulator [Xanthobacteraceae bacterium]|nr:LysR family transcriptional regulator [Xanthobacteraceae bacterium]